MVLQVQLLASALRNGRQDEATNLLAKWREVFGARLAVEVQLHHAGRFEEALAGALVDKLSAAIAYPDIHIEERKKLSGELGWTSKTWLAGRGANDPPDHPSSHPRDRFAP